MRTQAERAAESRTVKLADVQRQIKDGSLKVRRMTAKERKRFPPPVSQRLTPVTQFFVAGLEPDGELAEAAYLHLRERSHIAIGSDAKARRISERLGPRGSRSD
jgi:hypothetical protein